MTELTDEAVKALLPCPFCGGEAILDRAMLTRAFRVVCENCGVSTAWLGRVMDCPTPPQERIATLWNRRAERDRLRADAQAAVALVVEQAAEELDERGRREQANFGLVRCTQNFYRARDIVRALAPADGLAAVDALRDERDSLRQSLDACIPAVEEAAIKRGQAEAERDAALAQVEKLRHQITEASDPDFILGAMDNVNDMDVTLDGFAQAASRAIRAALAEVQADARREGGE